MTESVELDEIPLDDSTDEVEELDSRVQVMITMCAFILTDSPSLPPYGHRIEGIWAFDN